MLMYLCVVTVVLSDATLFSYCRGPRLPHEEDEEDGRAQQEVKDGTELRVRTRNYPVSHVVDGVPGCVAEEGEGHKVSAQVGIHVERRQRGRAEREHPGGLEREAAGPAQLPTGHPYHQEGERDDQEDKNEVYRQVENLSQDQGRDRDQQHHPREATPLQDRGADVHERHDDDERREKRD